MPTPFVTRFLLVPMLAAALPARSEPAHVLGNGVAIVERTETRIWSSGRKNGITGWQSAKCWELPADDRSPVPDMGPYDPDRGLLAQVIVAREPASNLDNFIAAVEGICYAYELDGDVARTSFPSAKEVIAASRTRADREVVSAPQERPVTTASHSLPTGVRLRLNPGKEYVKQIGFLAVHVSGGGQLDWANEVTSALAPSGIDTGKLHDLRCPSRSLLVGLGVRAEEGNGKIRDVKIFCREVVVKGELAGGKK
jgi:hypothetical protein